ncbi:hypothetical protein BKA83DRAFT_4543516 [Pisolithus microcarpus]|nr:hypothetical protein BKA83DRAFT_4543516 [Pisolithus microcarpus]
MITEAQWGLVMPFMLSSIPIGLTCQCQGQSPLTTGREAWGSMAMLCPRESLTSRREPLSKEQIHLVEHGGTGLDTGSCDLLGLKKPLHHEQIGSRECSDDVHVHLATVVTEMSSSNFTHETAYSTIQSLLGAPLPTHSDILAVHTTSGTFQEPLEALPTGGDTPTIQMTDVAVTEASSSNFTCGTLQVPSVVLPTGGDTSTIQMTDVAGDSVVSPEELHFCDNSINPDDIFDGSTFMVGRLSEAILDMIQEGLDHITAYLTDLATCSGQPPQQILDCFLKQYARLNPYFSQYTECELEHIQKSGSFTGSIESTPLATVCKKCYELFKREYHDTWQDILIKFKESMQYMETGKTVTQWQQLFNKSLVALLKAHSIKMASVMAGSIVNQDASLRYAYTTPGVEDFFMECCHADTNVIIGHFKAHIYSQLSLACVTEAFHADKKGKAKEHNDMGCNIVNLTSDNDDLVQDNWSDEQEDHNSVKRLITTLIENHSQSWASGKLFPWKQLLQKLGQNALVCMNWPDVVLFPRQEHSSLVIRRGTEYLWGVTGRGTAGRGMGCNSHTLTQPATHDTVPMTHSTVPMTYNPQHRTAAPKALLKLYSTCQTLDIIATRCREGSLPTSIWTSLAYRQEDENPSLRDLDYYFSIIRPSLDAISTFLGL